jgi:hypothetical protein
MLSVKVVKYGNMIAFRIIYKNSIAEDKRMLSKSKSSKGVVKSTDVSLQHLATLNSFLDGQLSQTQYIAKEIVPLPIFRITKSLLAIRMRASSTGLYIKLMGMGSLLPTGTRRRRNAMYLFAYLVKTLVSGQTHRERDIECEGGEGKRP